MILALLILIVSWVDVGYTLYGIRAYRLREANKLWSWQTDHPALFWTLSTAFHVAVLSVLLRYRAQTEVFVAGLLIRLAVLRWNYSVIRRLR